MIKHAFRAIGWVLVGMAIMGIIVWLAMPSLMLIHNKSVYNYDETVAVLSETVKKEQGWKILKMNDYQEATKKFKSIEPIGSLNIFNPG